MTIDESHTWINSQSHAFITIYTAPILQLTPQFNSHPRPWDTPSAWAVTIPTWQQYSDRFLQWGWAPYHHSPTLGSNPLQTSNPLCSGWEWWHLTWRCCPSSWLFHTRIQTRICWRFWSSQYKRIICIMQRSDSWAPKPGNCPPNGWDLRSCPYISQSKYQWQGIALAKPNNHWEHAWISSENTDTALTPVT